MALRRMWLLILLAPLSALADSSIDELRVGVLAHDPAGLWSSFRREHGVDLNAEAVFSPSLHFLAGTVRPALGASLNSRGDTSKVYLDARWELDTERPLRLSLGLGAALHDGEKRSRTTARKSLGSKFLFHVPIELIYRLDAHDAVSLYFDHMSNAGTAYPNEGMDTLGLRYGYRF